MERSRPAHDRSAPSGREPALRAWLVRYPPYRTGPPAWYRLGSQASLPRPLAPKEPTPMGLPPHAVSGPRNAFRALLFATSLLIAAPAAAQQLRINEILPNPDGVDDGNEKVEI